MTVEQQVEDLRGIVSALAASVVAHDNQIEALTRIIGQEHETVRALTALTEKNTRDIARVDDQIAALTRQWQAYLNRLPPQ
jgi:transposase